MRDPIEKLRRLEQADLRRRDRELRREQAALRRIERRERHRALWPRWVAFWELAAKYLKVAATVVTSLGVIGGFFWRAMIFYRSRDVGRPDQPPSSGARLFVDRVDPPKHPPDGGK